MELEISHKCPYVFMPQINALLKTVRFPPVTHAVESVTGRGERGACCLAVRTARTLQVSRTSTRADLACMVGAGACGEAVCVGHSGEGA